MTDDVREALYGILRFGDWDEEIEAVDLILSKFRVEAK